MLNSPSDAPTSYANKAQYEEFVERFGLTPQEYPFDKRFLVELPLVDNRLKYVHPADNEGKPAPLAVFFVSAPPGLLPQFTAFDVATFEKLSRTDSVYIYCVRGGREEVMGILGELQAEGQSTKHFRMTALQANHFGFQLSPEQFLWTSEE